MLNKRYTLLMVFIAFGLLATTAYAGAFVADRTTGDATQQLSSVATVAPIVQYVDVNGVTLGCREYGSGEPLLLICGFGATMDGWNATFISILASQYHIFVYDHRGMGYSSDNNATPSISQYADDAAGLIHALGYDSMNTYGTSMGSSISQQLIISHPDCVRKMVLSSATYSIYIPEVEALLHIIGSIASDPNQTQGLRNEALANLAWNGSYDGLAGIEKPIMLIVGTNDVLTPDSISVEIAGQINGSWLVRFIGIPHSGQSYAPVQYAESIFNFLGMNGSPLTPSAPDAPTDLVARAGDAMVTLSWGAPSDIGGSPITGYQVYRSATSNGTYALVGSLNGTTYTDTNISNGQVYWYKVSAANALGTGADSVMASAVPQSSVDNTCLSRGLGRRDHSGHRAGRRPRRVEEIVRPSWVWIGRTPRDRAMSRRPFRTLPRAE